MPRTKEQNKIIRHQRMEEILQAALKVYVEKGYAAAEVSDVAQRAGVAKGLVHYYFNDKATLFRELFTTMMKQANEHLTSVFDAPGSVLQLFENYVISMYETVFENREIVLFFMRMSHDLKIIFSEEEIVELNWPQSQTQIFAETLRKGMASGEIRTMSPELLAIQFSGALFHGLSHFLRTIETQNEDTPTPKSLNQDLRDAAAVCRSMLSPDPKQND